MTFRHPSFGSSWLRAASAFDYRSEYTEGDPGQGKTYFCPAVELFSSTRGTTRHLGQLQVSTGI